MATRFEMASLGERDDGEPEDGKRRFEEAWADVESHLPGAWASLGVRKAVLECTVLANVVLAVVLLAAVAACLAADVGSLTIEPWGHLSVLPVIILSVYTVAVLLVGAFELYVRKWCALFFCCWIIVSR